MSSLNTLPPTIIPGKRRIGRKRRPAPVAVATNSFDSIAFGAGPEAVYANFSAEFSDTPSPADFTATFDGNPQDVVDVTIDDVGVLIIHCTGQHMGSASVTVVNPAGLTFANGLSLGPPFTRSV